MTVNPQVVGSKKSFARDGVHIYCKSPQFYDMFTSFSNDTLNSTIGEGWGIDMQPWDLNMVLSDQMWDQDGASIRDYSDPDDYVPKTIRTALAYWNTTEGTGNIDRTQNTMLFNINFGDQAHAIPNISWLLSNKLNEGIKIIYRSPCSNRSFDLYYDMVKSYAFWMNQITEPRTDGFVFDSCMKRYDLDIDGQLTKEEF